MALGEIGAYRGCSLLCRANKIKDKKKADHQKMIGFADGRNRKSKKQMPKSGRKRDHDY
jgi:hypothetical protein